jgi:hypothetical protein
VRWRRRARGKKASLWARAVDYQLARAAQGRVPGQGAARGRHEGGAAGAARGRRPASAVSAVLEQHKVARLPLRLAAKHSLAPLLLTSRFAATHQPTSSPISSVVTHATPPPPPPPRARPLPPAIETVRRTQDTPQATRQRRRLTPHSRSEGALLGWVHPQLPLTRFKRFNFVRPCSQHK